MKYGVRAVAVLMHANLGLDEMRANAARRNLQPQALESHGIVIADNALLLHAEHVLPLPKRNRHESAARLRSRNRKTSVVIGQEDLCNEAVGRLRIDDAGERKFLWQPILQGAEDALTAPARLRRIGCN